MDFLDPQKERRQLVLLLIGYALIAVAIAIGTLVLLYRAYGFGINNQGQVIQNGFLFVSTTPSGAEIFLNGKDQHKTTDARLSILSGNYTMQLKRSGYRTWQQQLTLQGGVISRYQYIFLVPQKLDTSSGMTYQTPPGLATQSPDRRWVLVQEPGSDTTFDEYDLKNPKQPATKLELPASAITSGSSQTYELVEWSDDNVHVLLKHTYDSGKYEYVLLDRTNPDQTRNLSQILKTTPTTLNLVDKKFDHYYIYNASDQTLQTASLSAPTPTTILDHVLAYKGYGSNILLYASSLPTTTGKVTINLLQGGKTYTLRSVEASSSYLLDLTQYAGSFYVAAGASSEGRLFVYKNPVTQLNSTLGTLVPVYILRVPNYNYLAFSPNARFVMIENGSQFAVFDAEYGQGYHYDTHLPLDSPQLHAGWMDGNHLTLVSSGKLQMFDFDGSNPQTLMSAGPAYLPFFSPDYKFVDALAPGAAGQTVLTSTFLLTPADR